jgi:hypothetical protein
MIFELDHENITTALREYMDRRNIIVGKDFTFQMKTSRKGSKTSRAIITTVDVLVSPVTVQAPVEVVAAPQEDVEEVKPEVVVQASEEENEVVVQAEAKTTPFKKLFT